MADKFDPYREALVVETVTVWPEGLASLDASEQAQLADALHADPEQCGQLEYLRLHTGFCRKITITEEDLNRCTS
jgi:hypothetical protein